LRDKERKAIIVTGASSGIGRATAIKLVQSGYQVFGLARRYDKLSEIFSLLDSESTDYKEELFIPVQFDIAKSESGNRQGYNIESQGQYNLWPCK
jgi:NADP-dependent 3-hydroxy acid dehydrogenase YdfG